MWEIGHFGFRFGTTTDRRCYCFRMPKKYVNKNDGRKGGKEREEEEGEEENEDQEKEEGEEEQEEQAKEEIGGDEEEEEENEGEEVNKSSIGRTWSAISGALLGMIKWRSGVRARQQPLRADVL